MALEATPVNVPAFDIVVIGSGGGPCETDLSGYFLKSHKSTWTDGIVALEAGSGLGAVKELLKEKPDIFDSVTQAESKSSVSYHQIYSLITCFLITHAHLDHVSGLVLSAGSLADTRSRRRVLASSSVLKNLEPIFSGGLWPNLASYEKDDEAVKLLYDPLEYDGSYREISPDISVRIMPISHGRTANDGMYGSSVFFIRQPSSGKEFLFFGDVEPDTVSKCSLNRLVWKEAARMIPDDLSTIFIECSWPLGRKEDILFGHMSPEVLCEELRVLATEVVNARKNAAAVTDNGNGHAKKKQRLSSKDDDAMGPLHGVRVFITHCKDPMGQFEPSMSKLITDQVRMLVEAAALGAEILHASQGMHIII